MDSLPRGSMDPIIDNDPEELNHHQETSASSNGVVPKGRGHAEDTVSLISTRSARKSQGSSCALIFLLCVVVLVLVFLLGFTAYNFMKICSLEKQLRQQPENSPTAQQQVSDDVVSQIYLDRQLEEVRKQIHQLRSDLDITIESHISEHHDNPSAESTTESTSQTTEPFAPVDPTDPPITEKPATTTAEPIERTTEQPIMSTAATVENTTLAATTPTTTITIPEMTTENPCGERYRYNPTSNTCMRKIRSAKSWQGAKDFCESKGEYLATFASRESAEWLTDHQESGGWDGAMWIGGKKEEDQWQWFGLNTGEITFDYWKVDEPGGHGDCILMGADHLMWNDYRCDMVIFFACEKELVTAEL